MHPRLLTVFLLLFVLLDLGYSARQYYRQPLDGDMAWNLLPAPELVPTLNDPLGVSAVVFGTVYANPNRFFCHVLYREYLLRVPHGLQGFVDPVESVYLACAIAKWLTHLLLLVLLARLVVGPRGRWTDRLGVAAVLTPLFQAAGYRHSLGVVDPSTTYTFFYALPAVALLAYLIPFADRVLHGDDRPLVGRRFGWVLALAPVIALSGPLNPGAVGVLTGLGLLAGVTGYRWPRRLLLLGGAVGLLSAYSLFLGSYNALTIANPLPWVERYARLPAGLFGLLTTKLAWPVLLLALGANYYWVGRLEEGPRLRRAYGWLGAFALGYLLLLPLGGYRAYRPDIIRYDTLLPVTLGAFWLYGYTTWRLLRGRPLRFYWLLPLAVAVVFSVADGAPRPDHDCERAALHEIAVATSDGVLVDCPVLFWDRVTDPAASLDNVELLLRWGVLEEPRWYRQR